MLTKTLLADSIPHRELKATLIDLIPTFLFFSAMDSAAVGAPYSRTGSVLSTSTSGIESAWRRRQTIKRGKTRKVKLTNGNFVAEYPVPTPVFTAMEGKWTSTNTTE